MSITISGLLFSIHLHPDNNIHNQLQQLITGVLSALEFLHRPLTIMRSTFSARNEGGSNDVIVIDAYIGSIAKQSRWSHVDDIMTTPDIGGWAADMFCSIGVVGRWTRRRRPRWDFHVIICIRPTSRSSIVERQEEHRTCVTSQYATVVGFNPDRSFNLNHAYADSGMNLLPARFYRVQSP